MRHDGRQGYLRSVLALLDVPVSSQVLVFSKTSFQSTLIGPETPRAIYFNDDVYVGYVQGSDVLEFSAADPSLGGTFYLLDQEQTPRPSFRRQTHDCLQCHASSKTEDVPGHLIRSVYPEPSGQPAYNAGTFTTSHESPLRERWGGWYVTGTHGRQRHMGNVLISDRMRPELLDVGRGANRTDLKPKFDTSAYLAPGSDIVALLVLEHQAKMHNLITLTNYQARMAVEYSREINKALGEPEGAMSESTARRFHGPAEDLVRYMLFADEAELTDPIRGTSSFAVDFSARGPRDGRGRSLRDFDLETRIFRYPCSYLIYSRAFDALPAPAKERVYLRLWEVLSGKDQTPAYARRTPEERAAILEILRETKVGLPDYWKAR
ncbi:hypothetical protein [Aquisphaera giovannonii]|uniref:hypothetical protein n=1 Tax=Aquisphaera giovannonii TaxID=406548 RepID=UPI001AEFCBF9|nr:hypothetical protein [Aquisphaera giovannonii]